MTITETELSFNERIYTYTREGDILYLQEDQSVQLKIIKLTDTMLLLGAIQQGKTDPDIAKFIRVE